MTGRVLLGVVWVLVVAFALPPLPVAEETVPAAPIESAPVEEPPDVTDPVATPEPAPNPASEPAVPASESSAKAPAAPPAPAPVAQSAPPRAFAAAPGSVVIRDFSFAPSSITVGVGETVTWRNNGPSAHTATATDGSFDTGLLDRGESGSATFGEPGSFSYLCEPHPFMKGTVRVVAQTSSDGAGSDGGSAGNTSTDSSGSTSTGAASATDEGATLPATGADPLPLTLTGIGLLLIGLVGRRKAVT